MATPIRIGIVGSNGRMGRALLDAILEAGHSHAGGAGRGDDLAALAAQSDVLVDFSSPGALDALLAAARQHNCPLLIGTTGLSDTHHGAIDAAARHIPLLQTGNTSLGITLLEALVRQAAARLGPDWDIEILEMHHRRKIDAPSGTALLLGQAAANVRGKSLPELSRFDRAGVRDAGAIGFASLRGGSVAGDHQVVFATDGERLELGHRAESRAVFARGAIKAALWLAGKPPGRYTMADVLAL